MSILKPIVNQFSQKPDSQHVATEARNLQHIGSSLDWFCFFLQPQIKLSGGVIKKSTSVFVKKTGNMPYTATQTTTTNPMLNTPKLCQIKASVKRSMQRTWYGNIVGDRKPCRNLKLMKLFQPTLSPFF